MCTEAVIICNSACLSNETGEEQMITVKLEETEINEFMFSDYIIYNSN